MPFSSPSLSRICRPCMPPPRRLLEIPFRREFASSTVHHRYSFFRLAVAGHRLLSNLLCRRRRLPISLASSLVIGEGSDRDCDVSNVGRADLCFEGHWPQLNFRFLIAPMGMEILGMYGLYISFLDSGLAPSFYTHMFAPPVEATFDLEEGCLFRACSICCWKILH